MPSSVPKKVFFKEVMQHRGKPCPFVHEVTQQVPEKVRCIQCTSVQFYLHSTKYYLKAL